MTGRERSARWTPQIARRRTVLVQPTPQQRKGGASDIASIGKATNRKGLQGRVRRPSSRADAKHQKAMQQRLVADSCALRIGFVVTGSAQAARDLEADLLGQFRREHGELPPFNRNLPSRGAVVSTQISAGL